MRGSFNYSNIIAEILQRPILFYVYYTLYIDGRYHSGARDGDGDRDEMECYFPGWGLDGIAAVADGKMGGPNGMKWKDGMIFPPNQKSYGKSCSQEVHDM